MSCHLSVATAIEPKITFRCLNLKSRNFLVANTRLRARQAEEVKLKSVNYGFTYQYEI